jgi:hypothetical protein
MAAAAADPLALLRLFTLCGIGRKTNPVNGFVAEYNKIRIQRAGLGVVLKSLPVEADDPAARVFDDGLRGRGIPF